MDSICVCIVVFNNRVTNSLIGTELETMKHAEEYKRLYINEVSQIIVIRQYPDLVNEVIFEYSH